MLGMRDVKVGTFYCGNPNEGVVATKQTSASAEGPVLTCLVRSRPGEFPWAVRSRLRISAVASPSLKAAEYTRPHEGGGNVR
ncbi:hypothetical protein GN244_ATG13670 [Phytophthora infestans]|uniref:Uncharacterized protein n=1 Tax=Phytophthora infestans TaxID=4787 RepID=A0A833W930_PHYIN|nr:hypothetical protein GN244_ATG13670 [Phytophthora infestans]KAF4147049.1 hypothetical protein GN958_ATG03769 [Phytophthora infestans]